MGNFTDWPPSGLFVTRNYHILKQLKKNPKIGKILIVDFLPFEIKKQLRTQFVIQPEMRKYPLVKKFGFANLRRVDDGKTFVYTTSRNILKNRSHKLIDRQIEMSMNYLGFKNVMLWSYHPLCYSIFDSDLFKFKVFDTVDDWRQHDIHRSRKKLITEGYRTIDKKADVIFSVSRAASLIFKTNPSVYWIPNGVDVDHFSQQFQYLLPKISKIEALERIQGLPRPRIGYLGIIENRIDSELIEHLARKHPNWQFIFAGKVFSGFEGKFLKNFKNIHFLGQIPYVDAPAFLQLMDIGIVPHKITPFTKSMNPLKIYDYLGAGLPVVTTSVAGSDMFEDSIAIAQDKIEFDQMLKQALETKITPDKKLKRRNFVKKFSWENRFKEMQKHLPS